MVHNLTIARYTNINNCRDDKVINTLLFVKLKSVHGVRLYGFVSERKTLLPIVLY